MEKGATWTNNKTFHRKKWTSPDIRKSSRFWAALKRVAWTYVDNSPVHGFFHLRATESTGFKRLFWSLVIILSFVCGATILLHLVTNFFVAPFERTRDRPEMLMRIPFPSISICHSQTVIDYKSRQFVNSIKIPDGFSKDDIIKMLPSALGVFTENQWGPVNTEYLNTVHETLLLNGLSILDAVKAVGINCSEFVQRCSFNKKGFPCFQNHHHFTFRKTMTHTGVCCSFNYNPDNSSYQPLNVNSYGIRGGLSIIATSLHHSNNGTSGFLLSDGFVLLMHSPYDFPTEATSMALLEVGKVTFVGIYPMMSAVSADVIALPVASRKCLIGRDVGLNIYRRPACATKCMTQFVYNKCECHPYYLPAMDNATKIRDCVVTDGECFQRIYYDMKKVRCNACMPACEDILYRMSIEEAEYNFEKVTVNPIYAATNWSKNEFTVHIYFARSTVPVYRTFMIISFIDLLANLGGVFNLVLGISIISILELVYYFCIKLFQYMRRSDQIIPVIITNRPKNNMLKTQPGLKLKGRTVGDDILC